MTEPSTSSAPPPSQPPLGTRRLRWLAVAARVALAAVLALWLALAGSWALLHLFIVPQVDDWREPLARWASQALGAQLTIGQLSAQRDGLLPTLHVQDLRIAAPNSTPDAAPALLLPRAELAVSAHSLLRLGVEHIGVQGLQLRLQQNAAGLWQLGPWPLGATADRASDDRPSVPPALDWLMRQPWLAVDDAQVWLQPHTMQEAGNLGPNGAFVSSGLGAKTGQNAPAAALPQVFSAPLLRDVRLHWYGGRWQRKLRVDARWGAGSEQPASDIQLMLDMNSRGQWFGGANAALLQGWRGNWFGDVRLPDAPMLAALLDVAGSVAPAQFAQPDVSARGRLRGWLHTQDSTPQTATLDVALADVRLSHESQRLSTPAIQTRLHWAAQDGAQQLRLAQPLPIQLQLNEYQTRAHIQHLQAEWSSKTYDVAAQIHNVHFDAGENSHIPSVKNLNINLDANQTNGSAQLNIQNGSISFPGIFEKPEIALEEFQTQAKWNIGKNGEFHLNIAKANLKNADAQGYFDANYQTANFQELGHLDLSGELSRANATAVHRYLPLAIDAEVRDYVRQSVQSGQSSKTTFAVRGNLADFPFADGKKGEFKIHANLEGVDYDYLPADFTDGQKWPALKNLSGLLKVEGTRFALENIAGYLADYPSVAVSAKAVEIADLEKPILKIDAHASGPLAAMLSAASTGAVGDLTAGALADVQGAGAATLELGLHVPLAAPEKTTVAGNVNFGAGAAMQWAPSVPRVQQLSGSVRFSEHGFHLDNVSGAALGARVRMDGGLALAPSAHSPSIEKVLLGRGLAAHGLGGGSPTRRAELAAQAARAQVPLGVYLHVQGDFAAQALAQERALPAIVREVASTAQGQAGLDVNVFVPIEADDQASSQTSSSAPTIPTIAISSDLRGVTLQWPAPFNKAHAQAALPLWVRWAPAALPQQPQDTQKLPSTPRVTAPPPPALTHLQVRLGHAVQLEYVFEERTRTSATPEHRVLRGLWHIDTTDDAAAAPLLPAQGVVASIRMPELDADAWLQHAQAMQSDALSATDEENAEPTARAQTAADAALTQWLPSRLALDVDALHVGGRRIAPVHMRLSRVDHIWGGAVHSNFFTGNVQYHGESAAHPHGLIHARLQHLHIPHERLQEIRAENAAQNAGQSGTLGQTPSTQKATLGRGLAHTQTLPDLDISVGALRVADARLGSLRLMARNRRERALRFWAIETLELTWPTAKLSASGRWGRWDEASANAPRTQLQFALQSSDSGAWLDAVGARDLIAAGAGTVQGQLTWSANPLTPDWATMAGSVRLDLGRGRFLKVDPGAARLLSVLSLQSFARRLTLDFSDVFLQGFAFDELSGDVRIVAGQALTENLKMRGLAAAVDLSGSADLLHETQQLRVVVEPKISASAASLAAATVNPVLGLGTLLAQWVLGKTISEATTMTFDVSGPWTDPVVKEIPSARRSSTEPAAEGR